MTPKLRLNEDARKTLLSCILKFFLLGINRTNTSTQIMLAPATQANRGVSYLILPPQTQKLDLPIPLTTHIIHPRVSLSMLDPILLHVSSLGSQVKGSFLPADLVVFRRKSQSTVLNDRRLQASLPSIYGGGYL